MCSRVSAVGLPYYYYYYHYCCCYYYCHYCCYYDYYYITRGWQVDVRYAHKNEMEGDTDVKRKTEP